MPGDRNGNGDGEATLFVEDGRAGRTRTVRIALSAPARELAARLLLPPGGAWRLCTAAGKPLTSCATLAD